jgi:hypothetical protein
VLSESPEVKQDAKKFQERGIPMKVKTNTKAGNVLWGS